MPEVRRRDQRPSGHEDRRPDERAREGPDPRPQKPVRAHAPEDRVTCHQDRVGDLWLQDPVQERRRVEELEVRIGHEGRAETDERVPLRQTSFREDAGRPLDVGGPVEPDVSLEEEPSTRDGLPVEDENEGDRKSDALRITMRESHGA